VFADIANGTGPRISQHLMAAVAVLALTTALVRLSHGDPVRLRLFIAALAIGLALAGLTVDQTGPTSAAFPNGPPATLPRLWKYELSEPISVAALALCDISWRAGRRLPTFVTLVVLAALNVICDFRSFAVALLCTLMLAVIASTRRIRLRLSTVVLLGVLPCLLLIAGFFTAARAGWLGERSMLQFRSESVDVWTIMVNGRPEGLQSLYLISQQPYGWGSKPDLDSVTFARSLTFIDDHQVEVFVNLPKDWLAKTNPGLAAHSSALDTVVQAGLLAVPFWAYVLFLGLRRAMTAIRTRAGPLTVFWTVAIVWNVLFEPLVWPKHVLLAAYLALVLLPLPRATTTTEEQR
jgi:O-antigen ligase